MKLRLIGLGLLVVCVLAVHTLFALVHTPPLHPATAVKMLIGFVAVVTGLVGMLMAAVGGELLSTPGDHF